MFTLIEGRGPELTEITHDIITLHHQGLERAVGLEALTAFQDEIEIKGSVRDSLNEAEIDAYHDGLTDEYIGKTLQHPVVSLTGDQARELAGLFGKLECYNLSGVSIGYLSLHQTLWQSGRFLHHTHACPSYF